MIHALDRTYVLEAASAHTSVAVTRGMLAGKSLECAREKKMGQINKAHERVQQEITNSMSVRISPPFAHLSFVQIKRI